MPDPFLGLSRLLPPVVPEAIVDRLSRVIDPELGIDIVGLGLVCGAEVRDGVARVRMTTTTPACPIGVYLEQSIRWALLEIPGVVDVEVEMTHDPPWSPDRMSATAKAQLGWR
jgi:metal-sulfur cluster biosynthetic enzyme